MILADIERRLLDLGGGELIEGLTRIAFHLEFDNRGIDLQFDFCECED